MIESTLPLFFFEGGFGAGKGGGGPKVKTYLFVGGQSLESVTSFMGFNGM